MGHVHGLAIFQRDGEVTQIPLDEANAYFPIPRASLPAPTASGPMWPLGAPTW